MRRKILAVVLSAAGVLPLIPAAQAAAAAPAVSVPMQAQGTVVGTQSSPELRLKFTAVDGSNWLIEVAVHQVQNSFQAASQAINVAGTFTLGKDQNPLSSGTASGVLNPDNTGDLKLKDNAGTSLDLSFTANSISDISATVKGQWPVASAQNGAGTSVPAQPANHFFWYVSRTAALLAYLLFFASICFGLLLSSQQTNKGMAKWKSLDLHQFLALLGMGFLLLHIFSLLGDQYFNFTLSQVLFPVNLPYRPLPVALGMIVFWSSIIVFAAFSAKKLIGRKAWRLLHPAATVLFFGALIHAVTAGTDVVMPWVKWIYVLTAGVAVFALITQLTRKLASKVVDTPSPVYSRRRETRLT